MPRCHYGAAPNHPVNFMTVMADGLPRSRRKNWNILCCPILSPIKTCGRRLQLLIGRKLYKLLQVRGIGGGSSNKPSPLVPALKMPSEPMHCRKKRVALEMTRSFGGKVEELIA